MTTPARQEMLDLANEINDSKAGYPEIVTYTDAIDPQSNGKYNTFAIWIDTPSAQINNARDIAQGVRKLSRANSTHQNLLDAVSDVIEARHESWKKLSVELDRNHVHSALRLSQSIRGTQPIPYENASEIVLYSPWISDPDQLSSEQAELQNKLQNAVSALGGVTMRDLYSSNAIKLHDIVVMDGSMPYPTNIQADHKARIKLDLNDPSASNISIMQLEELIIDQAIAARSQDLDPAIWRGNVQAADAQELKNAVENLIV